MTVPDLDSLIQAGQAAAYVIPFLGVGLESLGVPIPGETSLIAASLLAAHGHANPLGVGAAAFAGAVLGDNAGYYIGRRWGMRLVKAPVIRKIWTAERIAKADHFFEGNKACLAVAGGRWVAGLRMFAGPLAGMHKMPWKRFFIANVSGAACWVAAITAGAFALGAHAHSVIQDVGFAGLAMVAVPVVVHSALKVYHRRHAPAVSRSALPPTVPGLPALET